MFTNVAVQVKTIANTNILTAVVRQYLSCYYFGKGVVNYQFCPISGIHTSYRGGLGYPPKAQISPLKFS